MVKENEKKNNPMRTYIFVLILLTVSIVHAAAPLTATYQAYAVGLNLLEATMHVSDTSETYAIQTTTQTKGLLGLFMDSRQRFFTQGRKESFTPDYSMMTRKGKEKTIDFTNYPNHFDYQTTVLALMKRQAPIPSITTYTVWDGKRVLLLTFTYLGKEQLPSSDTPFQGTADKYTLHIDILSGKKKGWFFERMGQKENPPLRLWFQPTGTDSQSLLVRGEFETALFGTITILLTKVH